ncbi:hypothetical protein RF11_16304 [Thelohanellus kitauei]|uniref:Uncharacterized protein n=1 Tax=Thelohanellus kitauei TaxID=669202 RepID=A0A0C2JW03_THEKT|nr:hypothetical protein RF11_16304 [Thelohanellus kitauei]
MSALPSPKSITRTIQRFRFINNIPMHLPENLRVTHDNAQFLMIDANVDGNRLLLFSTQQNLSLLSQITFFLSDGTYKTCPGMFQRFYKIHALLIDQVFPLVYALLPRKTSITY